MTENMPSGWRFIVELPPRNDCEATIEKNWDMDLPEGISVKGQPFNFPSGLFVGASLQWLEPSLLSVRLSVDAQVTGECARCLADTPIAILDDLMYLYHLHNFEFGKGSSLDSDDGFMPVEVEAFGRTIDIAEQVWETLLLLLPPKVLCNEDCLGLCPECGADLNEGACGCSQQAGDPRLEVLRSVL